MLGLNTAHCLQPLPNLQNTHLARRKHQRASTRISHVVVHTWRMVYRVTATPRVEIAFAAAPICAHDRGSQLVVERTAARVAQPRGSGGVS